MLSLQSLKFDKNGISQQEVNQYLCLSTERRKTCWILVEVHIRDGDRLRLA
jgi:hypothetical protein